MNMRVTQAHVMQIMDLEGHTTITWDPQNPDSVARAQQKFDELRRDGYAAFRMEATFAEDGVVVEQDGELIRRFDPEIGRIIMRPNMQGG